VTSANVSVLVARASRGGLLEQRPLDLVLGRLEHRGKILLAKRKIVRSKRYSLSDRDGVTLQDNSVVADLVDGKHDAVHVVDEVALLNVLPQDVTDGVVQAVEHTDQDQLILLCTADDVEIEIDVAAVDASQSLYHDDLSIGSVGLIEEILLKSLLLLWRGKRIVVVLGNHSVAIIVEDENRLHDVHRRVRDRGVHC